MWTNDSFLVLKEVCELVANHSISALVFLHPGPSLEAVAATLAHLGLPLLVVDHHHLLPRSHVANFAPSPHSLGLALADLLASEGLASSPVVFYQSPAELAVLDAAVAGGRLTGPVQLVRINKKWHLGGRRGEKAAGAGGVVVVLLSCGRAEGLAFLNASLYSGWLVRGSRLVLPCLDLVPEDMVEYAEVGAEIYLAHLEMDGTKQNLTALLLQDILTGRHSLRSPEENKYCYIAKKIRKLCSIFLVYSTHYTQ